ncbi:MAG: HAMP domain-containing protein, partial [Tepidisphaeraceae bacterium]
MRGKSSSARGGKSSSTTSTNKKNGRSSENGHDGQTRHPHSTEHRHTPAVARGSVADVFAEQPPIATLLGADRGGNGHSRPLDRSQLLGALLALKKGDFSVRLSIDHEGMDGKIADTFNEVIDLNQRMAAELERLSRVVGKEGKISQRASIGEVTGAWEDSVNSVNALISDLVHPISEMSRVIGAVAKGDLSQSMAMELEGRPLAGEFLRTAKTVNTMVDQLGSFASEVTRVAREVGTEGK